VRQDFAAGILQTDGEEINIVEEITGAGDGELAERETCWYNCQRPKMSR